MAPQDKPRHHSGYQREETALVEAACLTGAVTLGALMDRLSIVGGLASSLLIDRRAGTDPVREAGHAGTNDLDIGLAVWCGVAAVVDVGFEVLMAQASGDLAVLLLVEQGGKRWRLGELNVTIDFLIPPLLAPSRVATCSRSKGDFGVLIAPGLELAFQERELIKIDGHTSRTSGSAAPSPSANPAP